MTTESNKLAALRAVLVAAVDLIDAGGTVGGTATAKITTAAPATTAKRPVNTPTYAEREVSSSNISKVGFFKNTNTLRVWFHSGSTYDYYNVPYALFTQLVNAPSVGSFHNAKVKGKYSYAAV